MLKQCLILTGVLLTLTQAAVASAGGYLPGYIPDPIMSTRIKIIRHFIRSSLRREVQNYVNHLALERIDDEWAKAALQDMVQRSFTSEVSESIYVMQPSWKDQYPEVIPDFAKYTARSTKGCLGGNIYFDPVRLAVLGVTKAELVSLTIREYANHFGYEDSGHRIYRAALSTLNLLEPAWGVETGKRSDEPWVPNCKDDSLDLRKVPLQFKCVTVTGAVFERVARPGFGEAWKGPDGTVWSGELGKIENYEDSRHRNPVDSPVMKICTNLDARLPSCAEYRRAKENNVVEVLPNYFDTIWLSPKSLSNERQHGDRGFCDTASNTRLFNAAVFCVLREDKN